MKTPLQRKLAEYGLTQRKIAQALGLSDAAVSQWFRDVRKVPPKRARLLNDLYAIPLEIMNPDVWPPHAVPEKGAKVRKQLTEHA